MATTRTSGDRSAMMRATASSEAVSVSIKNVRGILRGYEIAYAVYDDQVLSSDPDARRGRARSTVRSAGVPGSESKFGRNEGSAVHPARSPDSAERRKGKNRQRLEPEAPAGDRLALRNQCLWQGARPAQRYELRADVLRRQGTGREGHPQAGVGLVQLQKDRAAHGHPNLSAGEREGAGTHDPRLEFLR